MQASLGGLTSREFWAAVHVHPALEDEYLASHRPSPGIDRVLLAPQSRFQLACCLSNDVKEWSVKLRDRHGLNRWISYWFINGDLKSRKPDPEIYRALSARLGISSDRILFADDRLRNL